MEINQRTLCGAILALAALWLWILGVGAERPGSLAAPAGDGALCLALLVWWCGAGSAAAVVVWSLGLAGGAVVSGLPPCWPFLLGLPAWLAVRGLGRGRGLAAYVVLAAGLTSLFRFAGKLLLLLLEPSSRVTLSGSSLSGSFWAELAPNLLFCLVFAVLLGAPALRPRGAASC